MTKQKYSQPAHTSGNEYSTFVFEAVRRNKNVQSTFKIPGNRLNAIIGMVNKRLKRRNNSTKFAIKLGCNLLCQHGGICWSQQYDNKKYCACKILPIRAKGSTPGRTGYTI